MYRVELKVRMPSSTPLLSLNVPNVPCGVESLKKHQWFCNAFMFLMYRVELKALFDQSSVKSHIQSS